LTGNARVRTATSFEELESLRADWLRLEVASGAELPFQTWDWVVAWWRHLRANGSGVRDHLRISAIYDSSGEIVGIAPLMLTERPSFGPIHFRYLQFIGADPNITEIRTLLCRPGLQGYCYERLREHLAARWRKWQWIAWEDQAATLRDCGMSSGLLHARTRSDFVLPLAPTWDILRQRLRRNIKESLRHCYNSLAREGLTASIEIVQAPDEIGAALQDFFRLHRVRAELEGAPVHPNVFATIAAQSFLREVCERLAERGVARVFNLRLDGQIVASRVAFEMGGALYLYYSGWDPAYARYSVMTTLVAEMVKYAIGRGLRSVHLSTGRDVSKTRWDPDEVVYLTGVEPSTRMAARTVYLAYTRLQLGSAGRLVRALAPAPFVRNQGTTTA
jgi:CelD/BcsL family acetyltransferase involved in cellulose biosynthesis